MYMCMSCIYTYLHTRPCSAEPVGTVCRRRRRSAGNCIYDYCCCYYISIVSYVLYVLMYIHIYI